MKKIRVKQPFKDMAHENCRRTIGEEFIEETPRADDLIARGFCYLVEDYAEPVIAKKKVEVETADVNPIVEEKKEKAVRKTVRKNAKK